jgi:hypothetical protein
MSSNQLIEDMFKAEKLPFDGSYTARLIEISVEKPTGMFAKVPDGFTAHTFSEHIVTMASNNYGVAIDRFLARLARNQRADEDGLVAWCRARMASMSLRLEIDENSGEARTGQYFCAAYAAARLAARYGVLPWSRRMISEAVKVAYAAHQKLQPGRKTERDLVGAVRKYIEESPL